MVNRELEYLASQLAKAAGPEDIFGKIDDGSGNPLSILRRTYHGMARIAHPDVYQTPEEKSLAQTTFRQLTDWFTQAEQRIENGTYGQTDQVIFHTMTRGYRVPGAFTEAEIFNFYPCTYIENGRTIQAVLRIVRDPSDNDSSQNETRVLNILMKASDYRKFSAYVPNLLDAFIYEHGRVSRHAAVFEKTGGWYSLEQVHRAYPGGIDPKDMAWIWRRLLVVLGFAHANSVIHSAVLPDNIWIHPEQHGLMLMNWFCSVHDPAMSGEVITNIDPLYSAWYPPETLKHESPTFGTDIRMSAKCMIHILGGDAEKDLIPDSIPKLLRMFLKGSILPGKRAPQDAWAVKQDFDTLLERLWGERKFHPFKMNISH